jgi:hypothetical protein
MSGSGHRRGVRVVAVETKWTYDFFDDRLLKSIGHCRDAQ